MARRFLLWVLLILAQSSLAEAQVSLPSLRLPNVTGSGSPIPSGSPLSALPLNGDRTLSGLSSDLDLDPRRLTDLRRLRILDLIRKNPKEIETDPNGAPIIRGEVVAFSPSDASLEKARAAGFVVVRERVLEGLDARLVVLQAPNGLSTRRALKDIRRLDGEGVYDFNHLYTDSGVLGAGAPAGGAGVAAGGGVGTSGAAGAGAAGGVESERGVGAAGGGASAVTGGGVGASGAAGAGAAGGIESERGVVAAGGGASAVTGGGVGASGAAGAGAAGGVEPERGVVAAGGGASAVAAAGAAVGAARDAAAGGAPGGVVTRKVGLIDGGVDTSHDVFRDIVIHQHGCSGASVPAPHGTAVASLMIGRSPRFHGAAPGSELYAADVYCGLPTGGAVDAVADALAWMVREHVPVINVSLVGPPNSMLENVVRLVIAHGHVVVAAVGNDGPAAPPLYPASYPDVVGVTAVDARQRVLLEACRGKQVKFSAPGADMSAANPAQSYASVRGTSFASPIVAGLLAEALPAPDKAAAQRAVSDLAAHAIDLGAPGPDPIYGFGLVGGDLRPALALAKGGASSD